MNVILTEKSLTLYFPNYSRPAILSAISIKHLIDLRIISQFVLAANQPDKIAHKTLLLFAVGHI